jgi:hypothetical protein
MANQRIWPASTLQGKIFKRRSMPRREQEITAWVHQVSSHAGLLDALASWQ